MRNVGPLHGTWLVALVFSACFGASAIASSQPWHLPGPASDDPIAADVFALSDGGPAQTTVSMAPHTPTSDDQPRDASEPRVVSVVSRSTEHDMLDEESVWEKAANHGSYVSAIAKESRGPGAGCEVSSVARSDVGKKNADEASSKATLVGSCHEDPAGNGAAGKAADKPGRTDKPDKAEKAEKSDKAADQGGAGD